MSQNEVRLTPPGTVTGDYHYSRHFYWGKFTTSSFLNETKVCPAFNKLAHSYYTNKKRVGGLPFELHKIINSSLNNTLISLT